MKTKTLLVLAVLMLNTARVVSQTTHFPREENSIRIMSYNIHNGIGMDGKTDYQRIADVIMNVQPDIVAVQEADSVTTRSQGIFVLKTIADEVLMYPVFASAIDYQGGKYGIGVLCKEKPVSVRTIPLPGREEKRVVLIVEFNKYTVACTHFSLTAEDRKASARILSGIIKEQRKPFFLAGDMNAPYESEEQEILRENLAVLTNYKQPTFPSDKPEKCIDYIYGTKDTSAYSALTRRVVDEKVASDHLPVFVDVRIKADVADVFRTEPYLQNPTDNGITVSWFTNVPVHSWVEYGLNGKLDRRKELYVDGQMICNNTHHKIRLENLEPGQTYSYRVCSREISLYQAYKKEFGETVYSDTFTFTLPSLSVTDFTAVIFNDIHKNNTVMDMFSAILKDMDYDLVVFNGDCIDDPKNEREAIGFLSYMNEKVNAENVPVIYMRGNHEIRNAYSIGLRDLMDYIGDKTYGSFSWGDTRFVMLDCGEDKPDSTWVYYGLNDFDGLRKDQVDFLKKELKSKAFKKAVKRVLIHHIPVYGNDDKYNPCLELWGGELSEAPFDICLNAHTHRYAYHPKGSLGNNYPVVIGGGNKPATATMMVLKKVGKEMKLTVLDTEGNEKLTLDL